jgi:hypothetical protein
MLNFCTSYCSAIYACFIFLLVVRRLVTYICTTNIMLVYDVNAGDTASAAQLNKNSFARTT